MSPEAQRIAIAEECGWKHQPGEEPTYGGTFRRTGWISPKGKFHHAGHWKKKTGDGLPDYLNDLNAMHEAEKVLFNNGDGEHWEDYMRNLRKVTLRDGRECGGLDERLILATAAQRAEAFLRTLGLWKEEPETCEATT